MYTCCWTPHKYQCLSSEIRCQKVFIWIHLNQYCCVVGFLACLPEGQLVYSHLLDTMSQGFSSYAQIERTISNLFALQILSIRGINIMKLSLQRADFTKHILVPITSQMQRWVITNKLIKCLQLNIPYMISLY